MRKLGKLPCVFDARIPHLASVMRNDEPPAFCNWAAEVGEWGMLANDTLGDCVPAAALHAVQHRTAYANHMAVPTDKDAISLYSQWAGYDPGNPTTDAGTIMSSAFANWLKFGVKVGDYSHTIEAYAQVDHLSPDWVKRAIWRCGGVFVGLNCPEAWLTDDTYLLTQTDTIVGGHCIYLIGYTPTALGVEYDAITWGARFRITEDALLATADEAYAILSKDWMDPSGLNPAGLDYAALTADMAQIAS